MNFSKKQSHKKGILKRFLKLHSFPLWMNNRFPWPDAHNNQVDIKKEQGLWKLLGTSECNSRYAISPLEGTEKHCAESLRELDGWRSVETLFEWCRYNPLSIRRERAGHSVDLSAPTVEHHWISSETRRRRTSSCFKVIKCSEFPSPQAESHSSLHALIKKCFAAERRDSHLHRAPQVILSAGRMCQAIILILHCLLSVGLSCACEPKSFRGS